LKFLFLYQAHYSTGAVAAGFTSTVLAPQTKHEAAIIEEDLVRYERVKKKGTDHSLLYCN
jgi:peptidyl-prolyl cis-trans isomerase-like protein 2